MESKLCTAHASLDAARARSFLDDAQHDHQRLSQVYADCFFEGSRAAAEAAVQWALKTTDSAQKAIDLADTLKSLPSAIPVRTAEPLAKLCAFLAISFAERECRAPLNTFCYAATVIRRAGIRAAFEQLHEAIRKKSNVLRDLLKRVEDFVDGITYGSEEADLYIIIGCLGRLASGMTAQGRKDIFSFLFELDIRSYISMFRAEDQSGLEDYDAFVTSQLASLAADRTSMSKLLTRSLVRSLEFGIMVPLLTLWTSYRSQMMYSVSIIGRDCFSFLVMAHAARLASSGNMSGCRQAVGIARDVLDNWDGAPPQMHLVISSVLITLCAVLGATSSSCGQEDVSKSIAEILRFLQVAKTTNEAREGVLQEIRSATEESHCWRCPETTVLLGLLLRVTELWKYPQQLRMWVENDLLTLIRSSGVSRQRKVEGDGIAPDSSLLTAEESTSHDVKHDETLGTLVTTIAVSLLCHPTSHVRLAVAESLGNLMNNKTSLFVLPSVLLHLQQETNGVVAMKIIRDILTSSSLLQQKDTCIVALNACMQSLGQSAARDHRNSTTYQAAIVALGYATESAPGIATSLLLREVQKLKEAFDQTRGPVRASASAAILKLVESRPTRGTNFIPFISLCIAPESMAVVPEAASLCFEAMNNMAEEEVLDPIKAVKLVLKSYPDVVYVHRKARRSYLKLIGSVANASTTKKGATLANKVVGLLRKFLTALHPGMKCETESSSGFISWDEVGQAAKSLGQFSTEEILRLAYAGDEPLLDIQAEAERKERIEKECQDFVRHILSAAATAYRGQRGAADSLQQLLVKIVAHEWENRQRSSFDPDRIAKLRAASDALRRARQARGVSDGEKVTGIDGFARALKGLPMGVVKGMFEECVWNSEMDEDTRKVKSFWIAVRVVVTAKALSRALPWVALASEVMNCQRSTDEERASCLAVFMASDEESFELKDARSKWFSARSPLFDSSVPTSAAEAKELFIGMVRFYPSEAVRLLFKYRDVTSPETTLEFIHASRELRAIDVSAAAHGLFPVVLSACVGGNQDVCEKVEHDFYEIILTRCDQPFVEELLMNNISERGAIRIACMTKSYNLLRRGANAVLAEQGGKDLLAAIGRTIMCLDAAHRREFVLDVCSSSDDRTIRERQHWLAAHVFGVASFLPYTEIALSVAISFCEENDRVAVERTIDSIM